MRRIRLLDYPCLVVSQVQAERCDGFGQVMRFGRSDDWGGNDGLAELPGKRDLGHADAAGRSDLLDGVDDRLVEG
jgi:hypothetical protein